MKIILYLSIEALTNQSRQPQAGLLEPSTNAPSPDLLPTGRGFPFFSITEKKPWKLTKVGWQGLHRAVCGVTMRFAGRLYFSRP